MNNFDDVFALIKQQCTDENNFESDICYGLIVDLLTGKVCMPPAFYIDSLVHTGIILHDKKRDKITLTPKGIQTTQLFI